MFLKRIVFFSLLFITHLTWGDLEQEVQKIVNSASLNKGTAGVCIIDTATNQPIININSSKSMIPASNQKLLTTGAALHVLGPEFSYETKLYKEGKNLIIVGDGDPTLGDTELNGTPKWSKERLLLEQELEPWIQAVLDSGMTEVDTLVVDDRIFDRNFIHPTWPSDQINNWYCAQVSGINYHLNVFHFFPSPNKGGRANLSNYTPSMPWLSISNKTSSNTSANDKSSFWVARSPNSNTITARGNVKATHTEPVKVAFHDGAIVFGNTLATELRKKNITVNRIVRIDESHSKQTGYPIYTRTTPIQHALIRSNRDSHNLYAESILKRISASVTGRPGTFDEGSQVVETSIRQRLGKIEGNLSVTDGSGMSRDNALSPTLIARWLASFDIDEPAGEALINSLATPGQGTLRKRFLGHTFTSGSVHAKSGYLRGVSSLSGYILFNSGRAPLVFSIIVNNINGTVKGAKKMQESIVFAAFNEFNN